MTAKFTYFGEEFSYAEEPPYFAEAEFFEMLERESVTPREATAIALRLAKACVDKDDLPRFLAVSRKNNAQTEDWLKVYRGLIEILAERPTIQPADSSAGQKGTPESSASQPVASVTPLEQRAEPKRPPRGDLALAVHRSTA